MRDGLSEEIMKEFIKLRAKTYSYLKTKNDKDKKERRTKKCIIRRKFNFQDYKNSLETAQVENRIKHLEKNKIDVERLKELQKELVKNNKLLLKRQQSFRSENHKVFTEEIKSLNDDKRMQSIDSIETYAYGMSKDLPCKKKEIRCNNIIKQYKNV